MVDIQCADLLSSNETRQNNHVPFPKEVFLFLVSLPGGADCYILALLLAI